MEVANNLAKTEIIRRYPRQYGVPIWLLPKNNPMRQEYDQIRDAILQRENAQFARQLQGRENEQFARQLQDNAQIVGQVGNRNVDELNDQEIAELIGQGWDYLDGVLAPPQAAAGAVLVQPAQVGPAQVGPAEEGPARGPRLQDQFQFNVLLQNRPGMVHNNVALTGTTYYNGMCPVCLCVSQELSSGACLYHAHTCPSNLRNERLWNLYTYNGTIGNCYTCGRASQAHGHYVLGSRVVLPGDNHWVCEREGGGGRREFIARLQAIIDVVNDAVRRGVVLKQNRDFIVLLTEAAELAAADQNKLLEASETIRRQVWPRMIDPNARFFVRPPLGQGAGIRDLVFRAVEEDGIVPTILGRLGIRGAAPLVEASVKGATDVSIFLGTNTYRGVQFLCSIAAPPVMRFIGNRAPPVMRFIKNVKNRYGPFNALIEYNMCPEKRKKAEEISQEAATAGNLTCILCGIEEEIPIYPILRFTHPNSKGIEYRHTDDQLICKRHLALHSYSAMNDDARFGCFMNPGQGCGGKIHPCEIRMYGDSPEANKTERIVDRKGTLVPLPYKQFFLDYSLQWYEQYGRAPRTWLGSLGLGSTAIPVAPAAAPAAAPPANAVGPANAARRVQANQGNQPSAAGVGLLRRGGKRNKKTLKKMNKNRQKKPGQKLSRCRRLN
jgi:hypothetical protein